MELFNSHGKSCITLLTLLFNCLPIEIQYYLIRIEHHQHEYCGTMPCRGAGMNPRTAQYLPGVVLQDFERGGSESQVPHLDDGHAVVLRGQHQLGGHLRVPQHSGTVHLEQANRRQRKRQQSICVPQYRLEGRDHVRPWDIR